MSELLHRMSQASLTVQGDGRTVRGIAVPFLEAALIRESGQSYVERFMPGAFKRTIEQSGHKVKLLAVHDARRFPLGRATELRETEAGLYIEARVSKTREGDEALELINDGVLDAFSVGFSAVTDQAGWDAEGRRTIDRSEVRLREVSLVPFPAYEGAVVTGVRTALDDIQNRLTADEARRRLAATYMHKD